MPDLDELLAGLEGEEEDQDQEPVRDNKAIKQIRRELTKIRSERDELRSKWREVEEERRNNSLLAAGLTPGQAKHFQGELTPESLAAFRADLGLAEPEPEPEPELAPEPEAAESPSFAPTSIPESAAVGNKIYSEEEFVQMMEVDPSKAMKLHKEGRVQLNKAPGGSIFVGRDR